MIKDTRQFTRRAKELMMSGKMIKLRLTLSDGNIAERVFTPVHLPKNGYVLYTHKMNTYEVRDSGTMMTYSTSLPSSTTEKGRLSTLLETLLISGYEVYES